MRHFSEKEKRLINEIIRKANGNNYLPINAFGDILDGLQVEFDHEKCQLVFYRPDNEISGLEILAIEKEIFERTILIEFLIDNRYVCLIDDGQEEKIEHVGGGLKKVQAITRVIGKGLSDKLYEYSNKRILVGQELVYLSQNNFQTIEEATLAEAKKQTRFAQITFVSSLVAIFISAFVSILLHKCTSTVELENSQYSTFKDTQSQIVCSLDSLSAYNMK